MTSEVGQETRRWTRDYVFDILREVGIHYIFGVPGTNERSSATSRRRCRCSISGSARRRPPVPPSATITSSSSMPSAAASGIIGGSRRVDAPVVCHQRTV